MENVDTCQLCYEVYDEETRRPRMLPCGHSYCTDCISKLIMNGRFTCPACNVYFVASDASQIPINYGMEMCISVLKEKKICANCEFQPLNKIRTMQDMIDSQKSSALYQLLSSEALERQLSDYQEYLENNIKKHKEVAKKLHKKAAWHESIAKQMTEEQKKTKETQEQVILCSQNMRANLPELDSADSNKAVSIAAAKVIETFGELASCLSKCQAEFPDPRVALSQKALVKSVAVLDEEDSCKYEEDFYASILSSSHLTISEKLTLCSNDKLSFTVAELRSDPDTWIKRINSGKLFAVSSVEGRDKFAAISMKDGQVYLHCLRDQEVAPNGYLIKEMENVDTCQLCYEVYDEETRRPRMLPCGHSYCTDCISKLIMNGRFTCPECNANFVASDSSQIAINYSLERCISLMKIKQHGTISKLLSPDKMRTVQDMIDYQKSSALNQLLSSEALERQLSEYQDFLGNNIKKHKELVVKLQQNVIWHESVIKQMTEEQEKTKETQKQVIIYNKNMRANLPELDCADSNKAVSAAVAKITETFCDLASCLSKCHAEIPDPSIALAQKALVKSMAMVDEKDYHKCDEDFCASVKSTNHLTILEKLTVFCNGKMSVTVDQLRSDPDTWKKIINSGKLFCGILCRWT
ncbi:uncharacterized protein [Macrobrachium rosenbergii]